MPLAGIRWEGEENSWDIHVLRNDKPSPPLDRILRIIPTTGPMVFATHPPAGVNVEFLEQFTGGPTNHGVSVNRSNGVVSAKSGSPIRNFLIQARVWDSNKIFQIDIRVHIHDSITNFWLTPMPLTVRRNTVDNRFNLLASFNDKTMGVIPPNSGVKWEVDGPIPTDLFIDGERGSIKAGHSSVENKLDIKAVLPAFLGGGVTKGQVKIVDSWSTTTKAKLIHGNPGKINENRNFLFVPDGFTGDDEGSFNGLVRDLVTKLKRNPNTEPFGILSGSFNYWSAFIPSRERGTSVLYDMIVDTDQDGGFFGMPAIVDARKPKMDSGYQWDLGEINYAVGLPIPADKTTEFSSMLQQWKKLFGNYIEGHITPLMYDAWREQCERHIANEKDTALGFAAGGRPLISDIFNWRNDNITWHPLRTTEYDFNEFVSNITYRNSRIGANLWKQATNTSGGGKDSDLVFILCGGAREGGRNWRIKHAPLIPPLISSSMQDIATSSLQDDDEVLLKPVPGKPEVEIESYPIPPFATSFTLANIAKESALSLGPLGEEKALETGGGTLPNDPVYTFDLMMLGNVQDEKSLLSGTMIDGCRIKWLWPRIAKAGVLKKKPEHRGGNILRITLKSKPEKFFDLKDEYGRLRGRRISPTSDASEELEIKKVDQDAGEIDVEVSPGTDITEFISKYPEDSVFFVPINFGQGARVNFGCGWMRDMPLVAPPIFTHIRKSHGPLDAPKDVPSRLCGTRVTPPSSELSVEEYSGEIPTNLPPHTDLFPKGRPKNSAMIIGLYEGGRGFDCGVYHPSGICLLQRLRFEPSMYEKTKWETKPPKTIFSLCHVCKYILVDRIDPTKHGKIDEKYKHDYPYTLI